MVRLDVSTTPRDSQIGRVTPLKIADTSSLLAGPIYGAWWAHQRLRWRHALDVTYLV